MSFDYTLFDFRQSINKETKEEIINSIHKQFYDGRGSATKNAKTIYQRLKQHDYQKPNQGYSVDHIKEFISKILYGEYYSERIPQQDNEEELKQHEIMREAINEKN